MALRVDKVISSGISDDARRFTHDALLNPKGFFINTNIKDTSSFEDSSTPFSQLIIKEHRSKRLNEIFSPKDMISVNSSIPGKKRGGPSRREQSYPSHDCLG